MGSHPAPAGAVGRMVKHILGLAATPTDRRRDPSRGQAEPERRSSIPDIGMAVSSRLSRSHARYSRMASAMMFPSAHGLAAPRVVSRGDLGDGDRRPFLRLFENNLVTHRQTLPGIQTPAQSAVFAVEVSRLLSRNDWTSSIAGRGNVPG